MFRVQVCSEAVSQRMRCLPALRVGILSVALVATGCVLNSTGLVAVKATHADGAYVVDSFPLGLHVRTRGDDPGVSLGGSKRRYIFDSASAGKLAPGWHLFFADLPARQAIAVHTQSIGIEVGFRSNEMNGTLGYEEWAGVMADRDKDIVLRLHYEASHPERTKVEFCQGGVGC